MKTTKLATLTSILLIMFTIQSIAQTIPDISKYNCFIANVHYSVDGEETDGLLLYVNHNDPEIPDLQYSNVYLLNKSGRNLQLVGDSHALTDVYNVKVSKDSKYVATYCVSEGHPWIAIYDLQKLINTKNIDLLADIDPYPGNIKMIGWRNNLLIIESDINLLIKNEGKDLSYTDSLKKFKKFSFDIAGKKFKEFK